MKLLIRGKQIRASSLEAEEPIRSLCDLVVTLSLIRRGNQIESGQVRFDHRIGSDDWYLNWSRRPVEDHPRFCVVLILDFKMAD